MTHTKDTGLAAIAASTRKPPAQPKAIRPLAEEKPYFEVQGERVKTSITIDGGILNYLSDMAHIANKRTRGITEN